MKVIKCNIEECHFWTTNNTSDNCEANIYAKDCKTRKYILRLKRISNYLKIQLNKK